MSNNVAVARVGVALVAALAVGYSARPVAAQQAPVPYTLDRCHRARAHIDGIFTRYRGKISQELVDDLKEFSRRDCDRSVKIRMMSGTRDGDAVSELKVILAARN